MQISNNNTSGTSAMKNATGVGTEDFLTLFITQLKNQDPLKPQDASQFVQQLATLSQVEQTYTINSNLEKLQDALNADLTLGAVSLVGKTATASSSTVQVKDQGSSIINYNLPASTTETTLEIFDSAGKKVLSSPLGGHASGEHKIAWDGTDNSGKKLPSGTYSFTIGGVNTAGGTVAAATSITGVVDAVGTQNGSTTISINGASVPVTNLLGIAA